MIFPYFWNNSEEILHDGSIQCKCHVCQLARKNCHKIPTSGLILLWGISSSAYSLKAVGKRLSYGGNVYPTYSRDLERCHLLYIRELQRQVSSKRQQLRSHFAARRRDLHPDYITRSRTSPNIVFYAPASSALVAFQARERNGT